uniref:Crystaline entomocidal protoxin n=1 Tax=Bacillus thuringiensis serovar mogi TaxID=1391189 RepID=V9P8G8_BACTU|nr:insecticidal protein Cry73Aa [Bacillus thuringiensis serovar mogi]
MNSYQNKNKNKYEMLDTSRKSSNMSTCYPRYPIAKNPQKTMQNTNYKDWINMCTSKNLEDGIYSTSAKDVITNSINISSYIISMLGMPYLSSIVAIWGVLFNALWPSSDNQWEPYMNHVQGLIRRELQTFAREQALRQLEGLGGNLDLYKEALEEWEQDRDNQTTKERVRDRFRILDGFFTQYIPVFRIQGYEVQLLSVYTKVANLHLLLLRDASMFGADWGMSQTNINDNYNRQMNLTSLYTNHCVDFYNQGLNEAKALSNSNWDIFNDYRREMTITVLDIVALFSSYDYRRYPITTKVELTREIYTPAIASQTWSNHNHLSPNINFEFYENNLVRPPAFFTWLDRTEMFSRYLSTVVSEAWGGHINHFHHTGELPLSSRSGFIGSDQRRVAYYDFNFVGNDVFRIYSRVMSNPVGNYFGVGQGDFYLVNRDNCNTKTITFTTKATNSNQRSILSEFPGENSDPPTSKDYSHRLSWISGAFIGSDIANVLSYGWTHRSVDPNNTIYPDKITQIPAVKLSSASNCTVIPGPGSTGGHLVSFDRNGSLDMQFEFITTQTEYRIRIRYASIAINTLFFSFSGVNQSIALNSTGASSLNNLRSEDFAYLEFPYGIFKPAIGNTLRISNWSTVAPHLVIDKIEFIPINSTTAKYERMKEIEKATTVVNSLFIN